MPEKYFVRNQTSISHAYRQELNRHRKDLEAKIMNLEMKLYRPGVPLDTDWFNDHDRLKNLRVDLYGVKSRIDKYGNVAGDEYTVYL